MASFPRLLFSSKPCLVDTRADTNNADNFIVWWFVLLRRIESRRRGRSPIILNKLDVCGEAEGDLHVSYHLSVFRCWLLRIGMCCVGHDKDCGRCWLLVVIVTVVVRWKMHIFTHSHPLYRFLCGLQPSICNWSYKLDLSGGLWYTNKVPANCNWSYIWFLVGSRTCTTTPTYQVLHARPGALE